MSITGAEPVIAEDKTPENDEVLKNSNPILYGHESNKANLPPIAEKVERKPMFSIPRRARAKL